MATDYRTALGLVDNAREQSFLAARLTACDAPEQGGNDSRRARRRSGKKGALA
jgi:hypothetical protein